MKNSKKSEFIDLKSLLATYRKHWWWFVISVIVVCGATYLYTRTIQRDMSVRANVVVRNDDTGSLTSMSGMSNLFGTSARVDDEVYVIASHSVLRDVAKVLGVNVEHQVSTGFLKSKFAYPEFPVQVSAENAATPDTLMSKLKFAIDVRKDMTADIAVKVKGKTIAEVEGEKLPVTVKTSYGNYIVTATDNFPKDKDVETTVTYTGYDVAAEDLAKVVSCSQASKRSNVVELSIATPNVDYGKAVLNEVIEQYNLRGLEEKNRQGLKTLEFIDSRLAMISGDLTDAEGEIQDYKQENGIVDVGTEAAYNMQMRSTAEKALVEAQTRSEVIKMTRDFLSQPENQYQLIPASTEIPAAAGVIGQYNAKIMYRMDLMHNERANSQLIKQLDEQLDALRGTINTTLDRAYQTSLVAIRDARTEANKALSKLGNVPAQEREYLNLKRNQEVKQQLYLFLLQRREETAMVIANSIPKGMIVDGAFSLSEPLGMGKILIMLIAFVIAMLIPPLILYIKKLLRTKFESRKEVESLTDVPVLGEVCKDRSGRSLIVTEHDTSSTTELFRLIRSSLQFMLNDADDKVILVTSTRSGEGKSFISVNLAASLSLLGKRVLLVGMDIRNPQLGQYLDLSNSRGVTNYLANPGGTDLTSMIVRDHELPGLDVLVAGPVPPNPGELLASRTVDNMFQMLRQQYDFIVVDSAPVGMVSDTFNLSRISDATIYVTRVNYTTLHDVDFLNSIYEGKRLRKLSMVVNGTTTASGYGYGYGYGQKHKS